jgi:hypothetical protein
MYDDYPIDFLAVAKAAQQGVKRHAVLCKFLTISL